ncbi:MAG: AAA family ATPase [Longimicrobiales bacterium]|nr:AAA family ATPase [Longimicrobiales bacterium]
MRIERIRVGAFGRLRDLDTGPGPLPGLVVVLGPNEAGKTTLFHFLTSMLYGFHPASRDGNPYAPWDGAEPTGAVTFRLDGGTSIEVERRLLSQPSGHMGVGEAVEDLRNRALPWAEHVPLAVFRQVFAVTLSEMAGLDEETWGRVQDRILGSMGSADLRPARHVVAELEEEAGQIWRPSRRGNQRAREMATQILGLKGRRREAAERDRRLRELVAEVERVRRDLQDTREARQAARMGVERVQALVPIRAQTLRIAALREGAGPPERLRGMPSDPPAEMEARRARVRALGRRLDEVQAERAEPQAAVDAMGDTERRLLEHADRVSAFLARHAGLAGDRDRHATLREEAQDLQRRAEAAAAQLLTSSLTDDVAEAMTRIPAAELRERVRREQATREERRVRDALGDAQAGAPPSSWAGLVAATAVLLSGAVLLAVGWGGGGAAVTGAGVVVAAVGALLLVSWLRPLPSRHPGPSPASEAAGASAPAGVAELLAGVPILPALLSEPSEALAIGVERVQDLLRNQGERSRAALLLAQRVEGAEGAALELSATLGKGIGLDAQALAHLLERELRQAQRVAEAAAASERELRRLAREEARVRQDLVEAQAALDELGGCLAAAGGGDLEAGMRAVRERIQARDRADQLQAELERAHPDLEEIRARIRAAEAAGESWTVDDDDLARLKASVEDLTHRVEVLATRAEALDKDVVHLRSAVTVDAIDGEIATLEEEERALLLERDRRWLLAQLLKEADRRFRDEHQPDVLRRAGEHLRYLTDGRYDRLVVEESAGSERFHLVGPGHDAPVALASPISRGTLEQAYLALRLAIVDHLDQGVERLPLFLDEVLVNWDAPRRIRGIAQLAELAGARQLFVFTCHADIAEELRSQGALVLAMDGAR